MTRDTDIDLLIVSASPGGRRKKSVRLRGMLPGLDPLRCHPDFDRMVRGEQGGHRRIAYPANKYGRVIYDVIGQEAETHDP